MVQKSVQESRLEEEQRNDKVNLANESANPLLRLPE